MGRGGNRQQGPGGGNQGPPDLDELWRNFNRRLGELFGRRGRGNGDQPPRMPSAMQFGGGGLVLIVLVFVVWAASVIFSLNTRSRPPTSATSG